MWSYCCDCSFLVIQLSILREDQVQEKSTLVWLALESSTSYINSSSKAYLFRYSNVYYFSHLHHSCSPQKATSITNLFHNTSKCKRIIHAHQLENNPTFILSTLSSLFYVLSFYCEIQYSYHKIKLQVCPSKF